MKTGIQTLIENPEVRDVLLAKANDHLTKAKEQIEYWGKVISDLGEKPPQKRTARKVKAAKVTRKQNKRTHGEAILHVLSLKKFVAGANTSQIKSELNRLGHAYSLAVLHNTINSLKKKNLIIPSNPGGKNSLYTLPKKD